MRDGKVLVHTADYAGFKEKLLAEAEELDEEDIEEDSAVLDLEAEIEETGRPPRRPRIGPGSPAGHRPGCFRERTGRGDQAD